MVPERIAARHHRPPQPDPPRQPDPPDVSAVRCPVQAAEVEVYVVGSPLVTVMAHLVALQRKTRVVGSAS